MCQNNDYSNDKEKDDGAQNDAVEEYEDGNSADAYDDHNDEKGANVANTQKKVVVTSWSRVVWKCHVYKNGEVHHGVCNGQAICVLLAIIFPRQ